MNTKEKDGDFHVLPEATELRNNAFREVQTWKLTQDIIKLIQEAAHLGETYVIFTLAASNKDIKTHEATVRLLLYKGYRVEKPEREAYGYGNEIKTVTFRVYWD